MLAHFGAEVKVHRVKAGLTQEQLGERVGYTNGLISAVERATRMPSRQLAEALDEALDTGGALTRLWPLANELAGRSAQFRAYMEREPMAIAIHNYEPHMVPGLLQTEEYARAVIASGRPTPGASERDARVAARMTRQEILRGEDPPRFWAIVDESVLMRPVGSPEVMTAQLQRLVGATEEPHITIQVFPYSAGISPAMGVPFLVAEFSDSPDMFHVDADGVTPRTDDETVMRYRLILDHLRASALREDESAAVIARQVEELRGR